MTLKEQLEKLKALKRRLAIWEAMHLLMDNKFIGKDGGKVGGGKISAIREPDTGDVISEDEIEDVLKSLAEGPITEIRIEISSLESEEVILVDHNKKASA